MSYFIACPPVAAKDYLNPADGPLLPGDRHAGLTEILRYERIMKMRQNYDASRKPAGESPGASSQNREQMPGSRSSLETAARAATAIVVFGIPLAVGTATVLGYGAYSLYKRLRRFVTTSLPEEKR
jgi:hypothetical protein